MEQQMFCYQCQETAGCSGCTRAGVCGKTAVTANLQIFSLCHKKAGKGIAGVTGREGIQENG